MTLRLNINLILHSSALAEDLDCLMSFIHSTAVGGDFHLTLAALKLLLDLVEDKTASKENKSSLYKTGRGHSSLSNLSAQMQVLRLGLGKKKVAYLIFWFIIMTICD